MEHGKKICEKLKQIRLEVAKANGIEYTPFECDHEGECPGTCPACEKEVKYIEEELAKKKIITQLVFDLESGDFKQIYAFEDDDPKEIITDGLIGFA